MSEEAGEALARVETKAGFLRSGARVGGSALAGLWTQALGPEAAGAAGQAIVEVAEQGIDFLERRERSRVRRFFDGVLANARRLAADGMRLRPEFEVGEGAEAVLEACVRAAAASFEEKKCDLLANLYSSAALDPSASLKDVLLYVRLVEAASWRQLVAVAYVEDESRVDERNRIGTAGAENEVRISPALGVELAEAARISDLIGIAQSDGSVANLASVIGNGQISTASILRLQTTGLGKTISRLGRLAELVDESELDEIAAGLQAG